MEDFKGLHDLTLVIPAYNRSAYLQRQIDYWSSTDVRLCILDGSVDSAPESLIAKMGPTVHYEHLPIGFNERLVLASKIVKTKYVALLGDDELYAKQGLVDCISQLESDERLIGCIGRSIFFFHRDGEIFAHQVYQKNQNLPDMFGDDLARVRSSFPNGNPEGAPYLLYGVFRREAWGTMFGESYGRHYGSGYVYELALMLIGAYLGPTAMVDSLTWFRSGENPSMSSAAVIRKVGTGEWGTSPKYADEYQDFVRRIVEVLEHYGKHSRDEIETTIRSVCEQFFAYSLHKPKRLIAYWHRTLYFFARHTPGFVKTLLKKNMTTKLGVVLDYKGVPFDDALEQLRSSGVSLDHIEMNATHDWLLKFHQRLLTS